MGLSLVSGSQAAPTRHRPSHGSHRYSRVPRTLPHPGQSLVRVSCREASARCPGAFQGMVGPEQGRESSWGCKRLRGHGRGWGARGCSRMPGRLTGQRQAPGKNGDSLWPGHPPGPSKDSSTPTSSPPGREQPCRERQSAFVPDHGHQEAKVTPVPPEQSKDGQEPHTGSTPGCRHCAWSTPFVTCAISGQLTKLRQGRGFRGRASRRHKAEKWTWGP